MESTEVVIASSTYITAKNHVEELEEDEAVEADGEVSHLVLSPNIIINCLSVREVRILED